MKKNAVWIVGGLVVVIFAVWAWSSNHQQPRANTNAVGTRVSTTLTTMTSPSFKADGQIPKDFTCDGKNINPELDLASLPPGARYLAIIMRDLDAPKGGFDHWVVWDIPATEKIGEEFKAGVTGKNSFNKTGYDGPCPPSGEHRYRFRVYGYNRPVALAEGSTADQLVPIMIDRALIQVELMGRYKK